MTHLIISPDPQGIPLCFIRRTAALVSEFFRRPCRSCGIQEQERGIVYAHDHQ